MSECRPHWDDELFDAVIDGFRITPYDDEVYAVIAAVEDWQKKRWASITQSPMEVAVQFNALEAAIQRVREIELVFPPDNAPPWVHGEARGWNKALGEVRRALECDEDGAA